ncbi:MAG: hypothetical protein ABW022_14895 [Actinoplanes sp.]
MATLQRTAGRKVTRRLHEPPSWLLSSPQKLPTPAADYLTDHHNKAVAAYGSNSGGWHAFDPYAMSSLGVFDGGPFPEGSVVSELAWGRIDPVFAQRLLEMDAAV